MTEANQRPDQKKQKKSKQQIDRELDEALAETFPASDPVAIASPGGPVEANEDPKRKKSGQKSHKNDRQG
jgi:hypothetical protein